MSEAIAVSPAIPIDLEPGFVPDAGSLPLAPGDRGDVAWHKKARQFLGRGALTLGLATSAVGADTLAASPAHADTVLTQRVYNTDAEGLYLHPDSQPLTVQLLTSCQMVQTSTSVVG